MPVRELASAKDLTVKFRYNVALDGITLDLKGNRILLLGSNGSGKTTLMRVLSGILRPTEGSVKVLGFDPFENPSRLYSRMLYVRDVEDIPYMMRVSSVIDYLSDLYGPEPVKNAVETLGLKEHAFKRVGELSKGLRRRVAMIEPLASDRELILMDEPFSGLDATSRIIIAKALNDLPKKTGLIIASHIPLNLGIDQMVVLEGGKLTYSGPYQEEVAKRYLAWMDFDSKKPINPSDQ
ncbi:ATP-binding cassette domain-containing protein [Thermococcus sp. Bubb.Bath]|uniref:ATP-binding cassette domain-containing protein n=1 Tax=Thermococcus sp. Bubb.Bath TaxID=1638242 RepID=UPI00143B8770|nr:ABC transporter ATP-binding protein [Thermococcus sp. Bubb.Bath]NJF24475.1 ABC transporter ATP-binding protein [Thermococcus sp. Bubb.Bath]